MSTRLSRAEQNGRNRTLLLAAARRVFLDRGYYAATLEQIADEAGFSKGVVYSRFASKADMFLALLEDRIEERAAANADLARRLAGSGNFTAVSKDGATEFPLPPRQLAELWLTIETGRALEQIANPDAFGGPGLPVLYRLGDWFAGEPMPNEEKDRKSVV